MRICNRLKRGSQEVCFADYRRIASHSASFIKNELLLTNSQYLFLIEVVQVYHVDA